MIEYRACLTIDAFCLGRQNLRRIPGRVRALWHIEDRFAYTGMQRLFHVDRIAYNLIYSGYPLQPRR